jgi:hypothetical protein
LNDDEQYAAHCERFRRAGFTAERLAELRAERLSESDMALYGMGNPKPLSVLRRSYDRLLRLFRRDSP